MGSLHVYGGDCRPLAIPPLNRAKSAQSQLPFAKAALEHFNTVHPHSSLKMRSPREFRQRQQRGAQIGNSLHCE